MTEKMTIGEMAAAHGVTLRALRFYEDKGLIAPERRGQSRFYSSADSARVGLIREWSAGGFNLKQVKEMLRLLDAHGERSDELLRYIDDRLHGILDGIKERMDGFDVVWKRWS